MKYMHSIIKGQRKAVIADIKKRLDSEGLGGQVKVEPDVVLKKEFYIEIDSEAIVDDVRQILQLLCKEKEVTIQGGLLARNISKSRQAPIKPPSINVAKVIVPDPPKRDYQIWEKVVILLSNHRSPVNPAIPIPLTKSQILSLLIASLPPDYPQAQLSQELDSALRQLEAQGEIYASLDNRFCIAQPIVLYEQALFRGDRAYLHLAHQLVGKPVTDSPELAFSEIEFDILKEKLVGEGVALITIEQNLQHLSELSCTQPQILQSQAIT